MTQPARTTWLLLGSVLLVSGAIWFLDLFAPIRTTGRPPEGRIVPFPEPEITGLSVQTGTLSVELQRDADTWILVSPVQAPADTFRVGQIFDQLLVMMRGETISRREQKELGLTPADYGLDTPRASITIHTGDTAETIRFGRAAPVGADLYVMIDGKPEILSTQTRILDLLPATLTGWRDRTLFTGNPIQIRRLEIQRRDGPLHLARIEGGGWILEKPVRGRTADDAVDRLLMDLFSFRVDDYIAESMAASALYGLDEPTAQITLYSARHPGGETILIGRPVDNLPGKHYAARRGSNEVFAVGADLLTLVQQPTLSFRDRRLVRLQPREIHGLTLEQTNRTIVLARQPDSDQWMIESPRQVAADASQVQQVLDVLATARIEAFLEPLESEREALGLQPPLYAIHVFNTPAADLRPATPAGQIIQFGTLASNGLLHASVPGETSVYLVSADLLEHIPFAAVRYRSPQIFSIRQDELRGLRLTIGDTTNGVDFGSEGPAPYPADHQLQLDTVKATVSQLQQLTAQTLIEEDPKSLAPYGLDKPFASLQITLSGGAGISKTLAMGRGKGPSLYATVLGTDLVFTLPWEVVEILTAPLSMPPAIPVPPPGPASEDAPETDDG